MNPNNRLVEVYHAKGEAEASIIKGKLESFGIESILKSNTSPSVYVFSVDDMGEVSVLVDEKDADDARELLKGEQDA